MKHSKYISGGLVAMLVLSVFVSFSVQSGEEFLGKLKGTFEQDTRDFGRQDFDGDGYSNRYEALMGTDPLNRCDHPDGYGDDGIRDLDIEGSTVWIDGLEDDSIRGLEMWSGLDEREFGELDSDRDGLTNAEELEWCTDILNPDTDGDGSSDGNEVNAGTDPLNYK